MNLTFTQKSKLVLPSAHNISNYVLARSVEKYVFSFLKFYVMFCDITQVKVGFIAVQKIKGHPMKCPPK